MRQFLKAKEGILKLKSAVGAGAGYIVLSIVPISFVTNSIARQTPGVCSFLSKKNGSSTQRLSHHA